MQTFLAIILIVATFTFVNGQELRRKCFVCNSAFDTECEISPPPQKYLVECSQFTAKPMSHGGVSIKIGDGNESTLQHSIIQGTENANFTSCRKDIVFIPEQINGEDFRKPSSTRIVRSCGWLATPEKDVCKVVSQEDLDQRHCACLTDACNSSPRRTKIVILFPTVFAILLIIVQKCLIKV